MRRQEESVAGNIVVAVLGLALLPITIIFNGMTLSVLWRDFVVPLGVRSITPAHAIGLCASEDQPGISWVIVGGESGSVARPFDIAWARSIVAQCREAGVPVFVKQMGDNLINSALADVYGSDGKRLYTRIAGDSSFDEARGVTVFRVEPYKMALHAHHGADPSEWPVDLCVQEFPR